MRARSHAPPHRMVSGQGQRRRRSGGGGALGEEGQLVFVKATVATGTAVGGGADGRHEVEVFLLLWVAGGVGEVDAGLGFGGVGVVSESADAQHCTRSKSRLKHN